MAVKKKQVASGAAMVATLRRVLADTYVLAVKTHGYHWNVTGKQFVELHTLFETHYTALFLAADMVAEQIRAKGQMAPTGMKQMLDATAVKEAPAKPQDAKGMIKDLIVSHTKMVDDLKGGIDLAAETGDKASEDLLTGRLRDHDKTVWMLKSLLA
ncbi:MAG: DNA starvation/stationary phase protection protein [Alphaproteobacteria bacterium]|nr:DNA starvation/stationary phase protection protein [Alphaproteobacteria bacterium]